MNIRLTRTVDDMAHTAAFFLVRREVSFLVLQMSLLDDHRRRLDEGRPPLGQGVSHEAAIEKAEMEITGQFGAVLDALAYYRHLRSDRLTRREVEERIREAQPSSVDRAEARALAERIIAELPARIEAHNATATGPDPAPEHSPFDPGFGPTSRFQAWADDALVPDDTAEVPLSDVRDAWHADHPADPPADEVTIRKWMNGTAGGIMGDKVIWRPCAPRDPRILIGYRLHRPDADTEDDEAYGRAIARYSKGCPAVAMEDVCADPAACAAEGRCKSLPQHATA